MHVQHRLLWIAACYIRRQAVEHFLPTLKCAVPREGGQAAGLEYVGGHTTDVDRSDIMKEFGE